MPLDNQMRVWQAETKRGDGRPGGPNALPCSTAIAPTGPGRSLSGRSLPRQRPPTRTTAAHPQRPTARTTAAHPQRPTARTTAPQPAPSPTAPTSATEGSTVLIEIWSDIVCPWCAIGKARLDSALATHPRADQVDVTWRSFQLDPQATSDGQPTIPRLAAKYGVSIAEAEAMVVRVEQTAAADGLHLDLRNSVAANTHDAHRLLHLSAEHGLPSEAQEAFMAAALANRQDVGDHDTLHHLATQAGLPDAEVVEVLATDRFADQVRADQQQAYEFGCRGVPFFVLDRRFAIAGAQSVEVFHQALDRALTARA